MPTGHDNKNGKVRSSDDVGYPLVDGVSRHDSR